MSGPSAPRGVVVAMKALPNSAWQIFWNPKMKVFKRLNHAEQWPEGDEYGRAKELTRELAVFFDLRSPYKRHGHTTEGQVYTVTTWCRNGAVLHKKARPGHEKKKHGKQTIDESKAKLSGTRARADAPPRGAGEPEGQTAHRRRCTQNKKQKRRKQERS